MSQKPAFKSKNSISNPDRLKSAFFIIWSVIGAIILIVAAAFALGKVAAALAIVVLASFIVFVSHAPVAWLERHKIPRPLGTIIAYICGFLTIVVLLLIFIPMIWQQVLDLIEMIPTYMNQIMEAFENLYASYGYLLENNNIADAVSGLTASLSNWAGDLMSSAGRGAITFGTGAVTTIVVITVSLIVGFWILIDLPKIGHELRVLAGPRYEETLQFLAKTLSISFGGYLRGVSICSLCTGILAGIGFWLIGLPHPVVLGLLTGLMNFVPYVGPWIAGLVAALIGLFVSPLTALLAILITILAQQLVDNIIYPKVMSSEVKLHPSIVLVAVFLGGTIGGIIGFLLAVPLAASVKTIFVRYFEKKTGRKLESENGVFFKRALGVKKSKGHSSKGKKHNKQNHGTNTDRQEHDRENRDIDTDRQGHSKQNRSVFVEQLEIKESEDNIEK